VKVALAKLFIKLANVVPFSMGYRFASLLSTLTYILNLREAVVSRINLKIAFPELDDDRIERLTKASLTENFKAMFESPKLWHMPQDKLKSIIYIDNQECIDTALEHGNGVIFAIPHIGSWEIIGLWVSQHYPMSALYRKPKLMEFDNIVKTGRGRFGATLVPDSIKGVMHLKKSLDKGETICILPDQDPAGKAGGVMVDFFNKKANTSTLVPKLAVKTQAKIIMAHSIRVKGGFKLFFKPAADAAYDNSLEKTSRALNREIEAIIMTKPEQYMWCGKRYRTGNPDGLYP
jgi:KDO2-lipid IV(A) lauroyltransferase